MAETWTATRRKKLLLKLLSLASRAAPGMIGGRGKLPDSPPAVQNILVVELWNIGDVVLTLPFLAQLRAIFPRARITMLARKHALEILAGSGFVDDFIVADLGWSGAGGRRSALAYPWRELWRLRRE